MLVVSCLFLKVSITCGQTEVLNLKNDSLNAAIIKDYQDNVALMEKQRIADSVRKAELEYQMSRLRTTDNLQKDDLLRQLQAIDQKENERIVAKKARIDSLRITARGYPVTGVLKDTLFFIYAKIGAATPNERAGNISRKIRQLYNNDFLKYDSILVVSSENTRDIVYGELIIMSVSENDAIWYGKQIDTLAGRFTGAIKDSIEKARKENSFLKLLLRVGLVLLVISIVWLLLWATGKGYGRFLKFVDSFRERLFLDLSYKDYTILTAAQEISVTLFLVRLLRWVIYVLVLYISLPIVFSIFPFSRTWANALFHLIWSPFRGVLTAVWDFLPNLFSIVVIYFVMKYVVRFVKYLFHEIENGKLKINGFHPDWALPTYSIVRFLLYAFMFVMIFPYLPGSNSNIFKGVSVFIGVLFSLGSSSAIANMVAGLVITYMRPFKIGDRIKIADVTGDVIEKTLLVTRIRTIKNEVITIPNSSVLTGNTTNYSSEASEQGLIIHTTVTIGYDVPWKDVHQALIEAAQKTAMVLKEPAPFVLQVSLEDFYVVYQLNAYTREAGKQALIYSELHQNIQDVFFGHGIEILSPHYRAARDGNMTSIPAAYLPKDYKAPRFNIDIEKT
ncbi:MAG TPA: transmembrane ion channel [Bacteroidales bacterium]|nr:MAG: transmembrane ion channel [Bacteroidetes bacterium GWE2_42_24]OFY28718.1 MAG: transmembrane ion channel [Bacteroidetes bacterium GWF2_43_11]HBZ66188.1 transmembrane ion channel [Bacteroidales bacterium]